MASHGDDAAVNRSRKGPDTRPPAAPLKRAVNDAGGESPETSRLASTPEQSRSQNTPTYAAHQTEVTGPLAIVEDAQFQPHNPPPAKQEVNSKASLIDVSKTADLSTTSQQLETHIIADDTSVINTASQATAQDGHPRPSNQTVALPVDSQTTKQQRPVNASINVKDFPTNSSISAEQSITHVANNTDTASASASTISHSALEVDSAFDSDLDFDADSAITDVHGLGSTQSARQSIYDFVEEHGRTFHKYKEGKYVLPNDAVEQDRLDLQHHLLKILLDGRLHLAPLGTNPQSVLDVGTGTGIWAIEFATTYLSASVIGSDLSPIQPDFVPPNCQFEIDDAEDEWTYTRQFHYIHMRGMMTCFSDPRSVLEKAYNQLEPGGYLEMQDGVFPMHCHDDTLAGTALDQWGKACVEAGAKIGRPWTNTPKYQTWMQEIGFEDVKEKIFEVPTCTWPRGNKVKEVGMWFQADMLEALGATTVLLTKALGWSPERCEMLFVDVRRDLRNRGIHAYMPVHIVWGKKPTLKAE